MTKPAKAVNPNHIFVDTNVLIGGYSGDPRFQKDAACLHYLYSLNGKKLYISTLSVAQLISVYSEGRNPRDYRVSRGGYQKTNDEIRRIVRELRHRFNVIDFTARDIDEALNETGADIEEDDGEHQSSVQYVLAMKQKCRIIITNNYKDYRLLMWIEATTPEKVKIITK